MREGTVYQLDFRPEQVTPELTLRNVEWGVLFAIDGKRTAGQIRDQFSMSDGQMGEVLAALEKRELIKERHVSYQEYVATQAASPGATPRTLAEFLFGGTMLNPFLPAQEGKGESPAPEPPSQPKLRPKAEAPSTPAFKPLNMGGGAGSAPTPAGEEPQLSQRRLISPVYRPQAPATTASTENHPPTSTAQGLSMTSHKQLSLKSVIEFILNRAVDLNAGQLDVYRVFIRVNTRLLKRNGIHSLRFEEDRLIDDPELQEAILGSVDKTLGVRVPEDVFVR